MFLLLSNLLTDPVGGINQRSDTRVSLTGFKCTCQAPLPLIECDKHTFPVSARIVLQVFRVFVRSLLLHHLELFRNSGCLFIFFFFFASYCVYLFG